MFTWNKMAEKGHIYLISYIDVPSINHSLPSAPRSEAEGSMVHVFHLEFNKAYDTVTASFFSTWVIKVWVGGLLCEVEKLAGLSGSKILVKGLYCSWKLVTSGVSQMFVLRSIFFFRIYIKDLEAKRVHLTNFVGYTKLQEDRGRTVGTLEGRAAIQKDLDKLEEWVGNSLMTLNKDSCKVLPREGRTHCSGAGWATALLKRSWEALIDNNPNTSQWCALAATKTSKILCSTNGSETRGKWSLFPSTQCLLDHAWNIVMWPGFGSPVKEKYLWMKQERDGL